MATPIKNAFNRKTAYWLSKRNYTIAVYMFTVENCASQKDLAYELSESSLNSYIKLLEEKLNSGIQEEYSVNKETTLVLDATTRQNPSSTHGEFVQCMNCGSVMLVDIGTMSNGACPECDEQSLEYVDFEHPQRLLNGETLETEGFLLVGHTAYESER